MPEVFTNHYAFPSRQAMPTANVVRDALAGEFGSHVEAKEFLPAGAKGNCRDWLNLQVPGDEIGISVYWHAEQPEIEIVSPGPMKQRMIALNVAMQRLGGMPRFDGWSWQARAVGRVQSAVVRAIAMLLVVAAAVAIIVHWGWWGLAAVILLATVAAALWFVGLARAFARG